MPKVKTEKGEVAGCDVARYIRKQAGYHRLKASLSNLLRLLLEILKRDGGEAQW